MSMCLAPRRQQVERSVCRPAAPGEGLRAADAQRPRRGRARGHLLILPHRPEGAHGSSYVQTHRLNCATAGSHYYFQQGSTVPLCIISQSVQRRFCKPCAVAREVKTHAPTVRCQYGQEAHRSQAGTIADPVLQLHSAILTLGRRASSRSCTPRRSCCPVAARAWRWA